MDVRPVEKAVHPAATTVITTKDVVNGDRTNGRIAI